MKRLTNVLIFVIISAFSIAAAHAATVDWKLSGQVRVRWELDKKGFARNLDVKEFGLLRTRLGVDAVVDSNARVFIQIQDSRMFGAPINGTEVSGTGEFARNVDLHQGYVQINRLFASGPGLRAGRFELSFGNQRLMGASDWTNSGRSWDGVLLLIGHPNLALTGFYLKRVELNNPQTDEDFSIFGANSVFRSISSEFLLVYEHDANKPSLLNSENQLDRLTLAFYTRQVRNAVDFEMNAAYQAGDILLVNPSSAIDASISAFLIAAELGYNFTAPIKPRLAAGIDYTSGDKRTVDDEWKAFNNLYYTGHKFRGYMDYFLASTPLGLTDFMIRGSIKPSPLWDIGLDFHHFRTSAKYVAEAVETNSVGNEVDFIVTTTAIKGATLQAGVATFIPTDDYLMTGNHDNGFWAYTSLIVGF